MSDIADLISIHFHLFPSFSIIFHGFGERSLNDGSLVTQGALQQVSRSFRTRVATVLVLHAGFGNTIEYL